MRRRLTVAMVLTLAVQAHARAPPQGRPSAEQLANDNKLFLSLAREQLAWEVPAEPVHILGPICLVGTKGLGAFLFATSEGHILMNTGMPSSGPMIAEAIRKATVW